LIGPEHLIKHCLTAHTRICFCGVAPLQKAIATSLELSIDSGFWDEYKSDMLFKIKTFNKVWDELQIPVCTTAAHALGLGNTDVLS
jgi:kynurenine aminotransferase